MTEDPKISQRYHELPREEPPRHVDEAILAAARRAAEARPAPLVVPSGRLRWYFPLAAAAIIVLAVAVTMHVEREQPDPEAVVVPPVTTPKAPAEEPPAPPQSQELAKVSPPRVFAPEPKPAPSQELRAQRDAAPLADQQKAPSPAPAAPPPPAARPQASPQDAMSGVRERADAQKAQVRRETTVGAVANFAMASPDQLLQGIADLRRQGRHEEADKALAEFRKRYPDYKISEAMLEKVEKR
jgi:hypothetical protein